MTGMIGGSSKGLSSPAVWITAVAAAVGLGLLSGCSSDDPAETTANRQAASGSPTFCQGGNARTGRVSLENRLNVVLRLEFDQIDCADWSGKTPAASSPYTLGSPTRAGPAFKGGFETTIKTSSTGATCNSPWRTRLLKSDGTELASFRIRLTCGGGGSANPPVYLQIFGADGWSYRNNIPIPPEQLGGTYAYAGLSDSVNLFIKPGGGPSAVRG